MAINETKVANMALALVKEEPLDAFDDDSKAAIVINNVYEIARNEVFDYPENWNFCSTRKQLNEIANADGAVLPDFGWDHQYGLPNNTRRIIATVDEAGDRLEFRYRREVYVSGSTQTDVLLCNETECRIRYVVLRTNPNIWPAWFTKVVYTNIALKISGPLTRDDRKSAQIEKMLKDAVDEALANNGMEGAEVSEFRQNRDLGSDMIEEVRGFPFVRITERA